jgi:hypothetical protein
MSHGSAEEREVVRCLACGFVAGEGAEPFGPWRKSGCFGREGIEHGPSETAPVVPASQLDQVREERDFAEKQVAELQEIRENLNKYANRVERRASAIRYSAASAALAKPLPWAKEAFARGEDANERADKLQARVEELEGRLDHAHSALSFYATRWAWHGALRNSPMEDSHVGKDRGEIARKALKALTATSPPNGEDQASVSDQFSAPEVSQDCGGEELSWEQLADEGGIADG